MVDILYSMPSHGFRRPAIAPLGSLAIASGLL